VFVYAMQVGFMLLFLSDLFAQLQFKHLLISFCLSPDK